CVTGGIWVAVSGGAFRDQTAVRRILEGGFVERFDVGPEGCAVGEDEATLWWCARGEGVDVDRGVAVHRRDDGEVFAAAGYRLHAGLLKQDAVDVDAGKVRCRTVSGHSSAADDVGASRRQQGRGT